jgi:fatty acid desaturase
MTTNDVVKKKWTPPRHFSSPSIIRALHLLIVEWIVIIGSLALVHRGWGWPMACLAWVLCGLHLHRLAVLGHDGAHFRFSKFKFLNDLTANLFAFYPLGTTVQGYRAWHFDHHRTVGTQSDPEHYVKRGRLYSKPITIKGFALMFAGDLLGLGIFELGRLMRAISQTPPTAILGLITYWCGLTFLVYYFNLWPLFAIYVFSIFTSFWAFFRVRAWSEHIGINGTYRFQAPLLARYLFFPHNTWCHYEHHKWPSVAWHKLAQARTYDAEFPVMGLSELFRNFSSKETPAEYSDPPVEVKFEQREAGKVLNLPASSR